MVEKGHVIGLLCSAYTVQVPFRQTVKVQLQNRANVAVMHEALGTPTAQLLGPLQLVGASDWLPRSPACAYACTCTCLFEFGRHVELRRETPVPA